MTSHTVKIFAFITLLSVSISAQQISLNDTTSTSGEDSIFVMSKSPWGAVLRSAVIPGWGQFYNESYLKIPVIWGLGIWLGYEWKVNNDLYRDYRSKFIESGVENDRRLRTFYRDQRDLMTIYMVLVYLANLIDAYVDANLFDFDVSENTYNKTPMLNLRVNF